MQPFLWPEHAGIAYAGLVLSEVGDLELICKLKNLQRMATSSHPEAKNGASDHPPPDAAAKTMQVPDRSGPTAPRHHAP